MIRFSGVDYRYAGGAPALTEVSVEIAEGRITALIGPNGSGKSTLARLMMGLLLPTSGAVEIDGLDTGTADAKRIRSLVALAWQNPDNQIVCGVVEDDVAFGPENLGLPKREIERRVDEVLEVLGLSHLRAQSVHNLSSAQKQILAVAGAMAIEPRYLILDEVTARLDSASAHVFLDAVTEWASRRKIGIVMITHLMSELLRAACVIRLEGGGSVAAVGSPQKCLKDARESDAMRVETPLYDTISHLDALGVRLNGSPETVDDLVAVLCR